MSKFSDFIIKCCRKTYIVRRYKIIKPDLEGVTREEFKKKTCPVCGVLIVERFREYKKKNGTTARKTVRFSGEDAELYLSEVEDNYVQIFNENVQKGTRSGLHWRYTDRGIVKDLNGKSYGQATRYLNSILALNESSLSKIS